MRLLRADVPVAGDDLHAAASDYRLARDLSRLRTEGDEAGATVMSASYDYQGLETCAACGLCAIACPVDIETGILTKKIRGERKEPLARRIADLIADNYAPLLAATRGPPARRSHRPGARRGEAGKRLADDASLERRPDAHLDADNADGGIVPTHERRRRRRRSAGYRRGVPAELRRARHGAGARRSGAAVTPGQDRGAVAQSGVSGGLSEEPGRAVLRPAVREQGARRNRERKAREVGEALAEASGDGRLPIVCDTSPCSYRLKQVLPERLRPLDIVEFVHDELMERLRFTKRPEAVAVHLTCSGRKMGLEGKLRAIAEACVETAVLPASVLCCGWAGDKGFTTPELNAHALRTLKDSLPEGCTAGYSHSRTCEIGLSMHAGVPYRSIVYLVDACTMPRDQAE